jgi:Transposase DDE domain
MNAEARRLTGFPSSRARSRLADRAYLQPERIAGVLDQGADLIVRAGWKNARWLDRRGEAGRSSRRIPQGVGLIDRPIFIGRRSGRPLALRLVAVKKPEQATEAARREARRQARKGRHRICKGTLAAAEWVILVTSLPRKDFPAVDILALYRLRWRIELAFKRLKSLIGLKGPLGVDERSAKPYLLAHLLVFLLLEPLVDELEDSTTLAWPSPPDPPRGMAPVAPARRVSSASDHARADHRLSTTTHCGVASTSPRTSETETRLPIHGPPYVSAYGA